MEPTSTCFLLYFLSLLILLVFGISPAKTEQGGNMEPPWLRVQVRLWWFDAHWGPEEEATHHLPTHKSFHNFESKYKYKFKYKYSCSCEWKILTKDNSNIGARRKRPPTIFPPTRVFTTLKQIQILIQIQIQLLMQVKNTNKRSIQILGPGGGGYPQ